MDKETQKIARFYNRLGSFYDYIARSDVPIYKKILQQIDLNHGGSAIDVGCGTGNLTFILAESFTHVTGIDISSTMLSRANQKAAEKNINNVTFTTADFINTAFKTNSYDFSFCSFVLHHLNPTDSLLPFLKKLAFITKHKVIIIDYGAKIKLPYYLIELVEKSFFREFIKMDYPLLWQESRLTCGQELEIEGYHAWVLHK